MQKFEYKIASCSWSPEEMCNRYAKEGWRIVSLWLRPTTVGFDHYVLLERDFLNLPKGEDKRWKSIE